VSGGQQWQVVGGAAQVYQRELVPAIFGPWAPRVVAFASPAAGERVIDVACGTGVVARLATERVGPDGRVVGLDLNCRAGGWWRWCGGRSTAAPGSRPWPRRWTATWDRRPAR
jgi:SAM-dependent methyltransferase